MPLYESSEISRDKLAELRKKNVCAQCGGMLYVFFDHDKHLAYLACSSDQSHEGIEREASPYQKEGLHSLNIETRRGIMNKQFGEERTMALAKYHGVVSLNKEDAKEIITTIWPQAEDVSPVEVFKAISICVQYGLNPLMRHLFLIPFWNFEKKRYDYTCVLGITANRLIASRKHKWTFLDDTPRISTEEEEIKHYRKLDPNKLRAITKLRDIDNGKEVTAWGEWPIWKSDKEGNRVANEPKGTDKGNSMENMACIHAERKGLDMLYPADLPSSEIPVIDESYIPAINGPIIEGELGRPHSKPEGGEKIGEPLEVTKEASDFTLGEDTMGNATLSGKDATESEREVSKKMLRAAASKLKWDQKRLTQELTSRIGTDDLDKLTEEQLFDIASKITDLAELA